MSYTLASLPIMARHVGNDLLLGRSASGADVVLPSDLRNRHLYVCGASRSGKSKFLESLIRQDIRNRFKTECGLLLIDWHGELYDSILNWLVYEDMEESLPVLPIDLRQPERIVSWNLLRKRQGYPSVAIANLIDAVSYVWGAAGTDATPTFASTMRAVLHVLYEHGLSFTDARMLLDRTPSALRTWLTESVTNESVREQWKYWNGLKPDERNEEFKSSLNRLQRFIDNPMLATMLGQTETTLDLYRALEEGWIVLVSLSRMSGTADNELCETFATLLLAELWNAAQERGKTIIDGVKPKPFYVYLDEFQQFVTPTLADNLDQAGGFGLHLTMAHQFPTQLPDRGGFGRRVLNSVFANAQTKAVFRTAHQEDLQPLALELFRGVMNPDEVKLVLESTKVLDYEESMETVVTESTDESTHVTQHDDENDERRRSVNTSSRSAEDRTFLRPVLGKETSSIQYRSLDEQLHNAAARINTQRERQAIVRLAEAAKPVAIRTTHIADGIASAEAVETYRNAMLDQWEFVINEEAAEQRMLERRQAIDLKFAIKRRTDGEEPRNQRRKIKEADT